LVNLNVSRIRRLRRELLVRDVPERVSPDPGRHELDPWIDAALRGLSTRQRAAVALAYLEDMPVEEIASALGCAVSTAKTHLARGRETLQRAAADRIAEGSAAESASPSKEGSV
jgi:RNA polymerase sigma factor (sigma-70 family)